MIHPLVDVLAGGLVKGGGVLLGLIPIGAGLQELLAHRKAVPVPIPDGIRHRDLAVLARVQATRVGVQSLVQLINGHPQHRLHLGEGLPLGTVGQHGQADQSGKGGHQMVGLALLFQRNGGIGQHQGEARHGGLELVGDLPCLGDLAGIARRQLGGLDVQGAGGHLRGDGGQHEQGQKENQQLFHGIPPMGTAP